MQTYKAVYEPAEIGEHTNGGRLLAVTVDSKGKQGRDLYLVSKACNGRANERSNVPGRACILQ